MPVKTFFSVFIYITPPPLRNSVFGQYSSKGYDGDDDDDDDDDE